MDNNFKELLEKTKLRVDDRFVSFDESGLFSWIYPFTTENISGYIDKFDNIWTKGPSRTAGEPFEWDVQLSKRRKEMLGWLSRDGSHINVSLKGIITHR